MAIHDFERGKAKFWLVGGGIASLAAAAFLIRDGGIPGHRISILEELDKIGGSLDGSGSAAEGYVVRGGRMLESKYLCTYELFDSIPTRDGKQSVTAEIFAWNAAIKTDSKSRLARNGIRETAPAFGLTEMDILTIERLALEPESMLDATRISDHFDPAFFKTNFWFMWCTTFAFQPWHSAVEFKRYLVRFAHMVDGFSRLRGIMRTVYNQYDSMVRPLHDWLAGHGVVFEMNTRVVDLELIETGGLTRVVAIRHETGGMTRDTLVGPDDLVMVTLGSMTESSSLGSSAAAPAPYAQDTGGAWALWKKLAAGRRAFGNPGVFANHVDESKWVSFTATAHGTDLLRILRAFTGNAPGEGGLITFPDSGWLASIVVPHQPHFIGQPDDVSVIWGYGLSVDAPGNFVKKPMQDCTGAEILTEMLGHLGVQTDMSGILETTICIPCLMPYITSQFLPRAIGDRPQVMPEGFHNLAFIGQFCELPGDVVFTVEYSIRSAQTAVHLLLGLQREPPPVYKGTFDPRVLFKAFMALHDMHV